jgi:hypothetical protein
MTLAEASKVPRSDETVCEAACGVTELPDTPAPILQKMASSQWAERNIVKEATAGRLFRRK